MRVKKYVVHSVAEAMPRIKQELGQQAIILDTKPIRTGGIFGWFGKKKVEVIAASHHADTYDNQSTGLPASPTKPVQESQIEGNVLGEARTLQHAQEIKRAPVDNDPMARMSSPAPDRVDMAVLQELKDMKKTILETMHGTVNAHLPPPLQRIEHELLRQGVASRIRDEWLHTVLDRIQHMQHHSSIDEEQLWQQGRTYISQFIEQLPFVQTASWPKMVCLVGPTGVGKTTTIAKLAAELIVRQQKRVGFITSDTYRIAAVEQLKTYANILDIPVEIVFDPSDLQPAMERLEQCDTVLMDTAGRNFLEHTFIDEVQQLVQGEQEVKTMLVLSLTSKAEDMDKIVHNFTRSINIDQLIFTKKDETTSYGSIVNVLHDYKIPLAYVTNGQSVPDDIEKAHPKLLAQLLLGDENNVS